MTATFEITNLSKVISIINLKATDIEKAAVYAVAQVGLAIERETKITLNNNPHSRSGKTWSPPGHIGGDGTPPNRRTGNLQSSVHTEVRSGFGSYEATVFPTMVYARRLEVGLNYPYLRPSVDRVRPNAQRIFTTAFMKKWKP
jgi:hypothetical protein